MWLQFTRRTYCQIPFIYDPKTRSKVWLLSMIKNREIFLVQLATRPFPEHIYRILRALLNSTLTRNKFGSFQTQTILKRKVPNHVSKLSRPKLDFHTHTHSFHTNIRSSILKCHSSLPVISFFLLFFSLLLLLLSYPFLLSLSPRPK